MKRFFILASAAIVALASCAKTEVVYKDAPEQIAFKQITNVMTKAPQTLTGGSLGVIAHYNGLTGAEAVYFSNTPFEWDATKNYYFATGKTWPLAGELDFTVYYPYVDGAAYDLTTKVLTFPVTKDKRGESLYFGSERLIEKTKSDNLVANLHHACAKITIDFSADNYTFVSATVKEANVAGTVNVNYNSTVEVTTTSASAEDITIATEETPVYVLPGDQTSIEVIFKQKAGDTNIEISRTATLNTPVDGKNPSWEAHKHYTYIFSVGANDLITFTAQTNEWTDGGSSTPELTE